jgi:bacterioferritin-associated ferredoxin
MYFCQCKSVNNRKVTQAAAAVGTITVTGKYVTFAGTMWGIKVGGCWRQGETRGLLLVVVIVLVLCTD